MGAADPLAQATPGLLPLPGVGGDEDVAVELGLRPQSEHFTARMLNSR